ncbi:RagB/SusD family nutrient uptake outer membrane protein [Sphingobacterium sp. SGR-19]|uniref:RagB/SusD family nutrient uptake outer membrane protein n=1 Tax=Sphingobacterium sp. SGR-19 TaxID=2710886 RepID=UPI0013EDC204|nr:RagB/SusD family nutrient uptake outer membrane protein [Sphingobacterium sp. SGR-19]NGM66566.1 RagB/SusD family nutrient uptake outer membrane protein [Sphingobacterium sp. SGR-19]
MKTIYRLYFCFFLYLLTHSCSKWVDVKPTDRLTEDQLFVNIEGYLKALNGVYVEMTHESLYGQTMTTGAIDVLGQYYFISSSTHNYQNYATFAYTQENVKTTFDDAWRKAYELIANCNVILENCGDEPSEVLPQPFYGIIKGETLALRAMLHLDMLRLFGPIYTEENKATLAIPYVNKTGYDIAPLLGSEEIMVQVVADLETAISLMADTDPIRTEGVRNGNNPSGSNDLYYRQYRLNYYATKVLLARAYLWQNNKADALTQATEVLEEVFAEEQTVFPFVTFTQATDPNAPDRLFSSEVMFALYDINRDQMYDRLFSVNLTPTSKLSFSAGDENRARVDEMYDDGNDYRRRIWQTASNATESATTNMKYADIVDGPGRYMIPLIRVSELLLIAAECHPDLTIATEYLNALRIARNTVNLAPATEGALKLEIGREYRREMIGEGQQFFFYKRNAYQSIPNHATITGVKTMVLNNYTVPLPDSETSQRN